MRIQSSSVAKFAPRNIHPAAAVRPRHLASKKLQEAARQGNWADLAGLLRNRLGAGSFRRKHINLEDNLGYSPLHLAVLSGSKESVALLLENGASLNAQDGNGYSPLDRALEQRNVGVILLLLDRYAVSRQPKVCADFGTWHQASLLSAIDSGNAQMAADLMSIGTKLLGKKCVTGALLQRAIQKEKWGLAKQLIDHGVPVHQLEGDSGTPFQLALAGRHYEFVRLLIERGALYDCTSVEKNPLQLLLQAGQFELARDLLRKGVNLGPSIPPGNSPVSIAVILGNREFVRFLLASGAEINPASEPSGSPLHLAFGKDFEMAELLLELGADVNKKHPHGHTVLHQAAEGGYLEQVMLCLQKGADVNAINSDKRTPLHLAIAGEHAEVAERLVDNGADLEAHDKHEESPLLLAIAKNSERLVRKLLSAGADVNQASLERVFPLERAIDNENEVLVSALLAHSADVKRNCSTGKPLLNLAIDKKMMPDIIATLLNNGARPEAIDKEGNTAIHRAAIDARSNILTLVLAVNPNLANRRNAAGDTPLHLAARAGLAQNIAILVKAGGNPHWRDGAGNTLLHLAIAQGHLETARIIAEAWPALIGAKNNCGKTAFHFAAENGNRAALEILLAKGEGMNERMTGGNSALHLAAEQSNAEVLNFLLEKGMDVNAKGHLGNTALHLAMERRFTPIISLLTAKRADPKAKNAAGISPENIQHQQEEEARRDAEVAAAAQAAADAMAADQYIGGAVYWQP